MIIDTTNNFKNYLSLNPLFSKVYDFLTNRDLSSLPLGRINIDGDNLFVNVVDSPVKSRQSARLETHKKMIDIQIPVSAPEEHGWTSFYDLQETDYDSDNDISFYDGLGSIYFTIKPGQFVIYFPTDAHAPAITSSGLRKLIFKVKA